MANKSWQGPYPESIEKAKLLLAGPCLIKRVGDGGPIPPPKNMFMVVLDVADALHLKSDNRTSEGVITHVAAWIDALPMNVVYIYASLAFDGYWQIEPVMFCDNLWEAEIESISRGGTPIRIGI